MNLLITMNLPYTRVYGGANRSNRALAEAFAARGHRVCAVVSALAMPSSITVEQYYQQCVDDGLSPIRQNGAIVFTIANVEVHAVELQENLASYLSNRLRVNPPDWTFVSSEDPTQRLLRCVVDVNPTRTVYLAHTPQMLPFGPASLYPGIARTQLIASTASVITISRYVAEYCREHARLEPFVNHPPHYGTGPFSDLSNFDRGHVLLMNACQVKGLSILLDLARRFPEIPFAALPGYGTTAADLGAIHELPNISIVTNRASLDEIFRDTRLLLLPSLWPEGFGMAAVDAMLRGIPVLGADLGGIPEAKLGTDYILPVRPIEKYQTSLGDNLLPLPIVPEQDTEPWARALSSLLTDRAQYQSSSADARERAHDFVGTLGVAPLEAHLYELAGKASSMKALNPELTLTKNVGGYDLSTLSPEKIAVLAMRLRKKPSDIFAPIPRSASVDPIPLSFEQEQTWFVDHVSGESSAYGQPAAVAIDGPLQLEALRAAVSEVVRRHEILRTVYRTDQTRLIQIVRPAEPVDVPLEDLISLPESGREAMIRQRMREESATVVDLSSQLPIRLRLLRLTPSEHVLIIVAHHIAFDGWSTGVLLREVGRLYESYVEGGRPALPELALQYKDYALWERQRWESGFLKPSLEYWNRQLVGAPALELPTDRTRPARQSFQGSEQRVELSAELTNRLRTLGQGEQATLYMVLLAGFAVMLGRYSGQKDFVIGAPVAGRRRAELEPLIGMFVNTVGLRIDLGGNPTVTELVGRLRKTCVEGYTNQDAPFGKVVDELKPVRDGSRNPIYQVMFAFQGGAPSGSVQLRDLEMRLLEIRSESSKLDLTLDLNELGDQLQGTVQYSRDLFEGERVGRMVRHYVRVLEWMEGHGGERISELELLDSVERKQAVEGWNGTEADYGAGVSLHGWIEEQAARSPGAVAVESGGERISYGELMRRSGVLAAGLREKGVRAETAVGICCERSIELVVGLLGILRAGGAYVPLAGEYPEERLRWMVEDAGIGIVLTQGEQAERVRGLGVEVVLLEEVEGWCGAGQQSWAVEAESAAYIIYTSGSTGRPKGVVNTHGGIVNRLRWMQSAFVLEAGEGVLQKTPYSFDVSVWELFWALGVGGRVVMARPGGHRDPAYLSEAIAEHGITTVHFVPSMLEAFLVGGDLERCVGLKRVICSGEALSGTLEGEFRGRLGAELHNLYGPTEAAVDVSWWACVGEPRSEGTPIGRPIGNVRLYVLDERMEPCPVGVSGELYIGGAGLGRGYVGRAGLTGEKFVPDPHGAGGGGRLYRTGDAARYRGDGAIEYIGRLDDQVKVRGFRIELGEIEAVLRGQLGVRGAAVVVRGEGGNRWLAAYVAGERMEASQLRTELRRQLPEYMIPATFTWLEQLPVTANGKLDRKALPETDNGAEAQREYVAPRTEQEHRMAALWADVLRVDRVGLHDNFFQLGGDSILAIQMTARAKRAGIWVNLDAVFRSRNLHDLMGMATAEGPPQRTSQPAPFGLLRAEDVDLIPDGVVDAYPLSMLQAGMLFHSEYHRDSPTYHDVVTFHLHGRLDIPILQRVLQAHVEAHPILRTSFDLARFSVPMQMVHSSVSIAPTFEDLSVLRESQQETAILEWLDGEKRTRFNKATPPLFRIHLHLRSESSFQFSLSLHHAILDGWSIATFLTQVFSDYLSALKGAPIQVRALDSAFSEYIALEFEAIASEATRNFWRMSLQRRDDAELPRLTDRSANDIADFGTTAVTFDLDICRRLHEIARELRVSLKSILLAAHLRVIATHSGVREVVTGMVVNGRPETTSGDKLLGLFLNTVPFRQKLNGGSWSDLIKAVLEHEIAILPHRRYPLGELQRENGRQALFDSVFNFVHFHIYRSVQQTQGLDVVGGTVFEQTNFPLATTFNAELNGLGIQMMLAYDREVFLPARIDAIAESYRAALESIAADPDSHYDAQSLLLSSGVQQVIHDWNDTATSIEPLTLDQVFALAVSTCASRIAAEYETGSMTYADLDLTTNRLARYLQSLGVGPEVRVATCLPTRLDNLIAFLSVLKAGGVYLAIDPSCPRQRVEFMLADSRPAVVLTRGALLARLHDFTGTVVRIDRDADEIDSLCSTPVVNSTLRDNTAYVIYTSGSTGAPKAVLVSHRGIGSLVESQRRIMQGDCEHRILQFSSPTFDASVFEYLLAFGSGGCLILGPAGALLQGRDLMEFLQRQRVSSMVVPPSVLGGLPASDDLPDLRIVMVAGELCTRELCERWSSRYRFFNLYGPTETTIWATFHEVVSTDSNGAVAIGRPILNTRTYLLDEYLQPVPLYAPGELYIAGPGLATGYIAQSGFTASRFVPDPFSIVPGMRMFRSGDLARLRRDGTIEFLGRADRQVKIRGHRIELGEIENALQRHPALRTAAVEVKKDSTGVARLVAYVQPNPGAEITTESLRDHLKSDLPEYMLPATFVLLESLPVTQSGKLDRAALPEPELNYAMSTTPYVPPEGTEESLVARCWITALGLDTVGANQNFFEVGGDSINLLRVQALIEAETRKRVSIAELFAYPTVRALANHLRQVGEDDVVEPSVIERAQTRQTATQSRRQFRKQARTAETQTIA